MADIDFVEGTGDIKREEFMILIDVSESQDYSELELLGVKVEDMGIDMNPNVEKSKDVTGNVRAELDKYEKQTGVAPYFARRESKLSKWLYNVVREERTHSDVERNCVCVNVFAGSGNSFDAWAQKVIVAVQRYGGDVKGLQIPFDLHWTGPKTFGTATVSGGNVTFSAKKEE